jgi:hypothetical protein
MTFAPKYIESQQYKQHVANYGKPFSIRLNDDERKLLDQWKETADIQSDSEAIKTLMILGYSFVTQDDLRVGVFSRLFKKERARLKG